MGCTITNPQNGLEFLHESVAVTKVFVETFCQTPTWKFKASAHVPIFFLFNTTYISLTMFYLKKSIAWVFVILCLSMKLTFAMKRLFIKWSCFIKKSTLLHNSFLTWLLVYKLRIVHGNRFCYQHVSSMIQVETSYFTRKWWFEGERVCTPDSTNSVGWQMYVESMWDLQFAEIRIISSKLL